MDPRIYRPPSVIESYYLCRQKYNLYSNYAISVKYNSPVTKALLSNALREIIKANSVFSFGARELDGFSEDDKLDCKNYEIGPVPSIKFDDVVEYVDRPFNEDEFKYINEKSCPVSDKLVTWKISVFSNNYVSFYNNHIFFDGESSVFFHEDLMKALDGLSDPDIQVVEELFNLEADGSEEHLAMSELTTLFDASIPLVLKTVTAHFLPKALVQWYKYYTEEGYPDYVKSPFFVSDHLKSTATSYKHLKLSHDQVGHIQGFCRSNGITVTAFFDVFIRYCYQQSVLSEANPPFSTQGCIVISGRRYFPEIAEKTRYNFAVTARTICLEPVLDFKQENVVPKMKLVKKIIAEEIESRSQFPFFGLLKYFSSYKMLNREEPRVKVPLLFEISNVGYKDIEYGKWCSEDIIFSQCLGTSLASGFSTVTTKNGMNVVLGVPPDFGYSLEGFVDCFYKTIKQFIEQKEENT